MDIDAASTYLRSRGLYVERRVPGGTDGITVARELRDHGDIKVLIDACFVYSWLGKWVYRNWNSAGGRGPDDVHLENLPLDVAVRYAEEFFFGAPLIVDGWVFPVNKHPEWDVRALRNAVNAAKSISDPAWRRLRYQRHTAAKHLGEADRFLLRYREIDSIQGRDDVRLWMRNDLSEAFLVKHL